MSSTAVSCRLNEKSPEIFSHNGKRLPVRFNPLESVVSALSRCIHLENELNKNVSRSTYSPN